MTDTSVMISRTRTATLLDFSPLMVEVEVDSNRGLPALVIIGLPTKAVDEAKERITSALLNSGIRLKSKRTIVNLAPPDVKKTGSGMDLAIAVGLLATAGKVPASDPHRLYLGELALDGSVKPVRGALALVLAAQSQGCTSAVVPVGNLLELATLTNFQLFPISHLSQCLQPHLTPHTPGIQPATTPTSTTRHAPLIHFSDIIGQEPAKRALLIAAAGRHNVLFSGPPGTGKTLLAQALHSLIPPLSTSARQEVLALNSLFSTHSTEFDTQPPFRSPHHSTTSLGLLGGGSHLRPGEISLAHRGVLFLDELAEFNRATLEALRQPLESKKITFSRLGKTTTFPADFLLVAATNPCPCGYYGSAAKPCHCSPLEINRYTHKLSGPLLDRVALHVWVPEVPVEKLSQVAQTTPETDLTDELRARVQTVRSIQLARQHQALPLSPEAQRVLAQAVTSFSLSARGYFSVIQVASTIADLANHPRIEKEHLSEALHFRSTKHAT